MLEPTETELVGRWVTDAGRVKADPTCERIERLVARHLERLAASDDGWSTLFRDPADARLWERTYPQSHMHGGGPPRLSCLSNEEAHRRYAF